MTNAVRRAAIDDAPALAAIYAPYVLETAISFEDRPPDGAEMGRRMAATLATHPFLVFEDGGEPVGYAYASPHQPRAAYAWSVNVSVYSRTDVHRRGVGRALYGDLLRRLTDLGFHSAFAGIALPNANSVGLHEAMGFVHLGTYREAGFKFGRWHDVGWWRRPLNEGLPAAPPATAW